MQKKINAWGQASLLALAWASPILGAQILVQSAVAAEDDDDEDVIVVTAQRREESLQTVAISATVLDAEMLENKGVSGLSSLQHAAPGIQIADYGSANTFNIRGIGQARVDIDLPSGVVVYRDGVPTLTGYFQNAPYYDMAGVEVLRGPQGTFVGKSASAGAVFLRTRDPELDEFGGEFSIGAGNREFFEGTLVVNQPLSDTVAVRLSAHGELMGSLFDSITSNPLPGGMNAAGPFQGTDDRQLSSVRVGVLWEPTDRFRAIFKTDYDDLDFGAHITTGVDPLTGALEDVRNPIVNGPHRYVDRGVRSSINLDYELNNGITLTSLTGFSTVTTRANADINASDPAPFGFRSGGVFTNWSQEFNVLSPEDQRLRWIGGLFWQYYMSKIPDYTKAGFGFDFDNGTRADYTTPWYKQETSYSAFGHVAYDLTDRLELETGVRWNRYEFNQFTNFAIDLLSFLTWGDPGGTGIGIEGDLVFFENGGLGHWQAFEEDSIDWNVNLNYTLNDNQFLYGVISRGHTPGSINLVDPDFFATPEHDDYSEMTVVNYEAGLKSILADGQVSTQLGVYYQEFENFQADFALAPGPGVPAGASLFQFQNAQTESIVYGVEFAAQAEFGDWQWDLGLAYNNSELGSFGEILNPFEPIFGGDPMVDVSGARSTFAPEYTGNAGASYTFNLANGVSVTPRVDVAYIGESYARLFQNPATRLEPTTLLNAQVTFERGPWTVNVWGKNLTDEAYAAARQNIDVSGPNATRPFERITGIVHGAPPLRAGVRVGREF